EGIAKITINRPEVRNAFRPTTLFELQQAFTVARDDPGIGVIILTGAGDRAFCSGGDQRIRGDDGYVDEHGIGRLNVLDLQVQIRRTPKPVIAMVAGYAIGGGHVLHVCGVHPGELTGQAELIAHYRDGPPRVNHGLCEPLWVIPATWRVKLLGATLSVANRDSADLDKLVLSGGLVTCRGQLGGYGPAPVVSPWP